MKKICFVATVPVAIHVFLRECIIASAKNWAVSMITTPDNDDLLCDMNAHLNPITIKRKVAPIHDLISLLRVLLIFRASHFDMVHSITPKAGLLSMFAAWMVKVPIRIHTFTGQVWATKKGWKRNILKYFDRIIIYFATHVLVDSPSQYEFLIAEGVLPKRKGIVIGHGSICGVDENRFFPDSQIRNTLRKEHEINTDEIVILYLGRFNRDKGILDLAKSFEEIADQRTDVVLMMVGAEEDVAFSEIQEVCQAHGSKLRRIDFTNSPERYMAAADIICLPSYREGFGQVIIEAAACGVPAVASNIYGIKDAINDGESGLLFPLGNVPELTRSLLKLINNEKLRLSMGALARTRALELFSSKKIVNDVMSLYNGLLKS